MPPKIFGLMLIAVLVAGAFTAWGISLFGQAALLVMLPVAMIAAVAIARLRK
jgi:hypothetical protein